MTLPFSAHGQACISVADSIMTIQSRGPWNVEYFTDMHCEIIETIKKHSLTNFAVLLIPYGEAIAVHEAIDYHVNFLRKGKSNAVAINLSCCDTPLSTENMCRKIYEAAGLTHEFFYDNEQAIVWLQKQNS